MTMNIPPRNTERDTEHTPSEREKQIAHHARELTKLVINEAEPESSASPSMAAKAAKGTALFGRYTAIVMGSFMVGTEIIRLWRPEYASVAGALGRFAQQFFGG